MRFVLCGEAAECCAVVPPTRLEEQRQRRLHSKCGLQRLLLVLVRLLSFLLLVLVLLLLLVLLMLLALLLLTLHLGTRV
jgi:uncharacterized protein YqhQ